MNKEDLEKLQKKFNEITEKSKKYSDLGYEKSNKVIYRKPENKIEEEFVKRVNFKSFIFFLIFTIAFLASFILVLISKPSILLILITVLPTIAGGYLTFRSVKSNELMIGKAVYKERKRNTSKKTRSYIYFVSVLDEENKLIYTRIQISKLEYDRVEEGTPILISKGSGKGYIYD